MKTTALALKGIRCKWISFAIILIQLSVCFAILTYSICAVFRQFDVVYTANGTHRGYLRISTDLFFRHKNEYEAKNDPGTPDFIQLYLEYLEKYGSTQERGLTSEQYDEFYADYCERSEKHSEDIHYWAKYQYPDFYERLAKSGFVEDTISNRTLGLSYKKGSDTWNVRGYFIDEKLYDGLRFRTKTGVDLRDYPKKDNYFYVLMYPYLNAQGTAIGEPLYGVGDILTERIYNTNKHCYEILYYEIVDELKENAYILPDLDYSGNDIDLINLESAFLSVQSLNYNGALIALKPEGFDETTAFGECFTLVKPHPDLTESEYSELLDIIRECGFNAINLDDAEQNTISEIWKFIRKNCLIIVASVLMVVFSIISISVLSGSQVRREYGVYRLCGADLRKVKALTAVKWALIFVPAMLMGIVIAIIYSKICGTSTLFMWASAGGAGTLFAALYVVSFIMSYKSASASYKSAELSE